MKRNFLSGLQIFLAVIILGTGAVFATQAGSSEDPLVAKSYVDDKIDQVLDVINETLEGDGTSTQVTGAKYTPVLVEVGQTITGKEGTEIILRSGKGFATVPGAEGIANITTGQELKNNATVTKNNLLIIPREDGRGVRVVEKAWFLVKGGYTIK